MRAQAEVILAIALALASIPTRVLAAPATARSARPDPKASPAIFDNGARMDANNVDMVVSNHGSLAYDLITGNAGLVFPKGSGKTAVFAVGPWMGAMVNGEVRVATGEYGQEFVPGPMIDGTFADDQVAYRSYKIVAGNTTSDDYVNWPVTQGAPTDGAGNPLLLGDATIWSVFNDANPAFHYNESGQTAPLGVEIQQTVFAYNRSGALGNVVFVRWKILNKGGNFLQSAYFSFWADPDLGGFTDDLVGCDPTNWLGYCYNATNNDAAYGSTPPAVGFALLRGPVASPSPGVYDTLGMTSFIKYINGTDPVSSVETYNYMSGLNADGTPIHLFDDPGQPVTTFMVAGDPTAGTGWLDSSPADRRLFVTSGPFDMAPGDVQEVAYAIILGQGTDRLSSISALRAILPIARAAANPAPPTILAAGVDLSPKILTPQGRGGWLFATIEPVGFDPRNIDLASVRLAGVAASLDHAVVGDRDGDGLPDITVKFSRAGLAPQLRLGVNDLRVGGKLLTGESFTGHDQVRVVGLPAGPLSASVAPNPMNPSGVLTFETKKPGAASVTIFDLQGRAVRTLMETTYLPAGAHELRIDARGGNGQALASGLYFYRVISEEGVASGRFAVLK